MVQSIPSGRVLLLSISVALALSACGDDPCVDAADCDDGIFCNGLEACEAGVCEAGVAPIVDDGITCTVDSCDEDAGAILNVPDTDLCGVGDICSAAADCTDPADGCSVREAEHPSYTTPNRDVVLCGGRYQPSDMDTACGAGWHVCLLAEWTARFPSGVYPNGTLSTWGGDQTIRCLGGVWQANEPEGNAIYGSDVCYDPMNLSNASYNPWNDGKFLYDDDGSTVLVGDGNCCNYDTSFSASGAVLDVMAVYCCRD